MRIGGIAAKNFAIGELLGFLDGLAMGTALGLSVNVGAGSGDLGIALGRDFSP